jgi:DNA-binding GntR family transcriptional regulator
MSTVEVVHRHLVTALLRGELQPGEWLRQDDLAAALGVSKVPVREALQRLAAEGLVSFEANRGSMVRTLTADDAQEIYALRRAIEPVLLQRSVSRLTIVDLAEAEMALDDTAASIGEANWRFHRSLYAGAGWRRGSTIVGTLHTAVAPYVALYTEQLGGWSASDAQHRELLQLGRAKETAKAVAVLESHLAEASSALVTYLQQRQDQIPR